MATAPRAVPKAVPKAEDPVDVTPVVKKKSKRKLIIILLILSMLTAVPVAYFMMGKKAKTGKETVTHEVAKPPVFVLMEPFTVNLQQEGSDQFLQISMTVQVSDEKQVEEIKLYMPQLRSRILLLLSGKKASEVNTPEGKKNLADEIIAQIKQPFTTDAKPQEVSNVFFTSFVIQ